jgi:glycine/D-amino acid oxidase-like deaminating enzyme
MTRATIRVGLPDLLKSSKYVITGSGISGAMIAHKLLQADPSSSASIVMLEARQICSGATGRNGGHCRVGRYLEFKNDLETFGEDEALRMEKLEEENVKNVAELIMECVIDCDLKAVEIVDIFTDQEEWEEVLAAFEARRIILRDHVEPSILTMHIIWSAQATREKLLVPEGVGAVSFPAYKLSSYKFICSVLDICLGMGLNLQANTPVLEVSPISSRDGKYRWTVHTDRGTILAENFILATNAYTSALYPLYRTSSSRPELNFQ